MVQLLKNTISLIHDSPKRGVFAITGGGSEALSRLLAVPGASRTVLEAIVPYHSESLAQFLGGQPDQACSDKTARAMAMAAFQRAMALDPEADHQVLLGLGVTSALSTDRQRRGDNKVFVCIQTLGATVEASLVLVAQRSRKEEESLVATLIIDLLAEVCGLPIDLAFPEEPDIFHRRETVARQAWQDLLNGESNSSHDPGAAPQVLFPGAFNPLHDGHRTMIRLAETLLEKPVTLEISVFNVDKPPLDYFDLAHREAAVGEQCPLIFTHAPTFVEKSAIFPGVTFVVGVDTVKRIAQSRYYNGSMTECLEAISTIRDHGNQFLVFGRQHGDDFESLDDLDLPEVLRSICHGVEEEMFRHDISSSQLRAKNAGD
ncbi:MAG: hypothetical protein DRR06_12885 [Gammaproteobacteria bacterium]|nr:MAG: hypothetical protein DRR06_12885 [Gammaproteobacteria bacterium]RLA44122.1 MAG: hypothetical protein DRR42_20860 [Gammaproteobacteria bacterium]